MNDFMTRFSINCHSSIRCGGETVLWFDPFRVEGSPQDGDVIEWVYTCDLGHDVGDNSMG